MNAAQQCHFSYDTRTRRGGPGSSSTRWGTWCCSGRTRPPQSLRKNPEAYEVEVEEVKGVEITARRGKKTVGVFSTYMAIF